MYYYPIIIAFLVAIFLSVFIIPQIIDVAFQKKLFDEPNQRKIHKAAIPRLGGFSFFPVISFALSFTLAIGLVFDSIIFYEEFRGIAPKFFLFICGLILLYLMGIKDDLTDLRYNIKFVIQLIVASFFIISGLWINNLYGLFGIDDLAPFIGIPLTILFVVFIINSINLIDGIDGLASGLCSISLLALGIVFIINESWLMAMLAFTTLGAVIPFFYYNVFGRPEYHNKIFMGDTGSMTLGYVVSFLFISLVSPDMTFSAISSYPLTAIVIVFSTCLVPVFDVLRVMVVRVIQGQSPFLPDQNHIHHKFLQAGLSSRMSMLSLLLLSVLYVSLNIVLIRFINVTFVLLADLLIWSILNLVINKIATKKEKSPKIFFIE